MKTDNEKQTGNLVLTSFEKLQDAINSKITPPPGMYKINITSAGDCTNIRFTLPHAFIGKRFELSGTPASRTLVEDSNGVLFNAPEKQTESCYSAMSTKRRGLTLRAGVNRLSYEVYWDGKQIILGNVLDRLLEPTPIARFVEPTKQKYSRPIEDGSNELNTLRSALATVNEIARKRGMEVIVREDGSVGLKMVVETVF